MWLYIWIALCFLFMVTEMLMGEMTAFALAVGTLGALLAAALHFPVYVQLIALGICSLLSLFLLRPLLRSKLIPPTVDFTTHSFVSQTATVLEPITPEHKGKVKIQGETWFATASTSIPEGQQVIITGIDGATLQVIAKDDLFTLKQHPLSSKEKQILETQQKNLQQEGE